MDEQEQAADELTVQKLFGRTSRLAVASLVAALTGTAFGVVAVHLRSDRLLLAALGSWLVAILLAIIARRVISQSDGWLWGRVFAGWGLWLSAGAIVTGLLLVPSAEARREKGESAEAIARVERIVQAILAYAAEHNLALPPAKMSSERGEGLSWRVTLLPYLGEHDLYMQFKLDESWDSEHNRPLLAQMPDVYRLPFRADEPFTTPFQACIGSIHPRSRLGRSLKSTLNGMSSQTILVIEARQAVPWTKPADLTYSLGEDLPLLGTVRPTWFFRRDPLPAQVTAGLAEGSVRTVPMHVDIADALRRSLLGYDERPRRRDW